MNMIYQIVRVIIGAPVVLFILVISSPLWIPWMVYHLIESDTYKDFKEAINTKKGKDL